MAGVETGRKASRTPKSGPVSLAEIRDAALTLFSDKTFPVIGMRDISEAVGIRPGSLYAHISSKEELLANIVREGIESYLVELTPIVQSDPPPADRAGHKRCHFRCCGYAIARAREPTRDPSPIGI